MTRNKQKGFTLIELMIAVVITAILVAIAYPSYTNQVTKARRGDGIAALEHISMLVEGCRSDNATYAVCETSLPYTSEDGFYVISAPASFTATAYSLIATPQGIQATKDAGCGNLTLTSTGTRGRSGTVTPVDTCWGQ